MTDDDLDKSLEEGFATQAAAPVVEPPKDGVIPPAPVEEPKKDAPVEVPKEEVVPPAVAAPNAEAVVEPPKVAATPPAPDPAEESKPLTKDDVTTIISNLRETERTSGKELEATTAEVMDAYYPEGLSNTLVDQNSGKELRTPQDVVEASNGNMSTEEATQWLMNEQYKLDNEITRIKSDASRIAEQTVNFKRDSLAMLDKYDPLFKEYPHLQTKAFNLMMKQVKADEQKGVILAAPDVRDLYDTYLEPYQQAFEYAKGQPATNPNPVTPITPPTPSADDRLDEGGDGGQSPVDDPNDFAQQVNKELAKGL